MAGSPASSTLLQVGEAPAAAMAMTCLAMADSLALAMSNAVAAQQRGQVLGQAALTQVLAMIVVKGGSG